MFTQQTSMPARKKMPSKLIAGFAALSITAIMTASGLASATSPSQKPTHEDCQKAGFTNYGQCVKEWAHHKNHPGHGYGGSTSIATTVNLNINNSNNNIIKIIVNVFN